MQERTRTSHALAAATLIALIATTAGCASAPQVPDAPEAPGVALDPAQDFARPERARAKMRADGKETIPGESEEAAAERRGDGLWHFAAQLYVWAPSVDGELSADADVDLSVSDGFDAGPSYAGRLEGSDGDWGFLFEALALRTDGEDGDSDLLGVSFEPEIDLNMIELGATKSLGSAHTFSQYSPAVHYQAIGGVRWFDADTKLNFGRGANVDAGDEDWFDPFIGARATTALTDDVTLAVRGDVGGFGIGEASDLSWRADAAIRVRVMDQLGAFVGWQALGVDQERGSGLNEFKVDLTFSGPYVGMQLDF